MLLSLQSRAGPPAQAPPPQVSLVVQALPSSQEAVLFACTHPLVGLHESSVQTLLSLQLGAVPPTQLPFTQVSFVVQALLSLHDVPSVAFGFEQTPVAVSHVPAL